MTPQLAITLVVLAIAVLLFLSDRLRPDLVALLALLVLGAAGVLSPQEVFSGFSRAAVITIIAIFVLAEGLRRTRATDQAGSLLLRVAGHGEGRLVTLLMLAGATLSLFMNNIAAAAVLLPVAANAARRSGVSASRLMMPLAFATILGGMATLLTTTNIVTSSLLRDQGLAGFGLLDFAPVGVPMVALGMAYMVLLGRKALPALSAAERLAAEQQARDDLVQLYGVDRDLFQVVVPLGSILHQRPLRDSEMRERFGAEVVAIQHDGQTHLSPPPDMLLHTGDVLLLEGDKAELQRRDAAPFLAILPPSPWAERDLRSEDVVVAEAVVAPRSGLIDQTLREAHFRSKYGMNVLAIWRAGQALRTGLSDLRLAYGDALLLQGPHDEVEVLRGERDIILYGDPTATPDDVAPTVTRDARVAWLILAITLVVSAFRSDAIAEVMFAGALAMVLARLLTMDQAYDAVEWKTVFLVAGMLPLAIAMTNSGAASLLADGLLRAAAPLGPYALLVILVVSSVLLAQTMHGAAVAAIMTPVAIRAAQQSGLDPRSLAMAVALATSMAFITPLGHPVNLLVMGLGGYRARDFLRVGLPLTLLVAGLMLVLLPLVLAPPRPLSRRTRPTVTGEARPRGAGSRCHGPPAPATRSRRPWGPPPAPVTPAA